MPRPKVRVRYVSVGSLFQRCLYSIARMFLDSTGDKNDVEETCTINPNEGECQSVLKCISNPFEELRKSHVISCFFHKLIQCFFVILASYCLAQIVDTLRYRSRCKNKLLSLLITPQTRSLDLEFLRIDKGESTMFLAAFQLMQLAAAQCPVHLFSFTCQNNSSVINIYSCSNLHIF